MATGALDLPPAILAELVTISDLGDIRRAADALDCGPKALAGGIGALERATGRQLLVPDGDTAVLGPVGERVAATARTALNAMIRFQAIAEDDRSTLRVAHVADTDTLSLLLEEVERHSRMHVSESVVPDDHQFGQLRACRLDVAACTATGPVPADLDAVPLRVDPLVTTAPTARAADARMTSSAVVPLYGRAWRAHDELVEAYARSTGHDLEGVPVPLGSGRESAALHRAARGRPIVAAASATAQSPDTHGVKPELYLEWRLAWRRDDTSPLVREFIAAAQALAKRRGWLDRAIVAKKPPAALTLAAP